MEKKESCRIALIGIIVEDENAVARLNAVLHDAARHIIGRMGVPCRRRGVCVISVAVDAPQDVISSLSGKLGMIDGVSVKTVYSRHISGTEEEQPI